MRTVVYDHRKPAKIAGQELEFYLKLDSWTLVQAIFLIHGFKPPDDVFTYEEASTHFPEAYALAYNSIKSGTLAREITIAGKRRYIASPAEWIKWAADKGLPICSSLRAFHAARGLRTDTIQGNPKEARKQSTQERNQQWQDRVNELARQYPLKSHSDLCRTIAKEPVAGKAHWQTIRRNTRKG